MDRLKSFWVQARYTLTVECYPGTFEGSIKDALVEGLLPTEVVYTPGLAEGPKCVDKMFAPVLGEDARSHR